MQEIIFWLTCGVYLVTTLALIQRTRSTGDVGYVAVGGVVFGVPLVVHLLAAYCFIAGVRQHTSKPAIDLLSLSFDKSILPLTALGLVIALYVCLGETALQALQAGSGQKRKQIESSETGFVEIVSKTISDTRVQFAILGPEAWRRKQLHTRRNASTTFLP